MLKGGCALALITLGKGAVLGEYAHGLALGNEYLALLGVVFTCDKLEKRGLSASV